MEVENTIEDETPKEVVEKDVEQDYEANTSNHDDKLASINESKEHTSNKIGVEKDDDQLDVGSKPVEIIREILEKTELETRVDTRSETAEQSYTDQNMKPLENSSHSESENLDENAPTEDNIQSKLSVQPADVIGKEKIEGEPEGQTDNDLIEIFDSDVEHSDDDNEDFDAELDRELKKMFVKQVKYNIRNELVSDLVGAETTVMLDEKDFSGRLRKRKHEDEPDDPSKKQRIHHIQEGVPKSNQLNYNSCIKYSKDENSRPKWIEAYNSEIKSIVEHGTWDREPVRISTVDRDKMVGTLLLFSVKSDGRYKCRLVARGDTQGPETYDQTSSNNMHYTSLLLMLNLAIHRNYYITQIDVKTAYLYAKLDEELYIRCPPRLGKREHCFRLRKSLYGLKQSGYNWYLLLKKTLENMRFEDNQFCPSVYKAIFNGYSILIAAFVDDLVIISHNLSTNQEIVNKLRESFEIKVLTETDVASTVFHDLGHQVTQYWKNRFTVSRFKYIDDVIKR